MSARERTSQIMKQQPYRCFLVRCRLEEGAGPDGAAAWRFSVQQADANAPRRSFVSLQEVAAHLEAELASCAIGARTPGAAAPNADSQESAKSHEDAP